jgi:hypothetical protein
MPMLSIPWRLDTIAEARFRSTSPLTNGQLPLAEAKAASLPATHLMGERHNICATLAAHSLGYAKRSWFSWNVLHYGACLISMSTMLRPFLCSRPAGSSLGTTERASFLHLRTSKYNCYPSLHVQWTRCAAIPPMTVFRRRYEGTTSSPQACCDTHGVTAESALACMHAHAHVFGS